MAVGPEGRLSTSLIWIRTASSLKICPHVTRGVNRGMLSCFLRKRSIFLQLSVSMPLLPAWLTYSDVRRAYPGPSMEMILCVEHRSAS